MAAVPGANYLFEYGSFSANIAFRNQEPPAVEMEPFVQGAEPSDYHFGTIKLISI